MDDMTRGALRNFGLYLLFWIVVISLVVVAGQ